MSDQDFDTTQEDGIPEEVVEPEFERDRGKISEFFDEVEELKQVQSTANTAHASYWKNADSLGINKRALKIHVQIGRLSHNERVTVVEDLKYLWAEFADELGLDIKLFDTKTLQPEPFDDPST